ncbi:MAG: hypothetical protein ACI8RD_014431 [Bacillariaceae sp.]|jgi:hypothetical protein
MVFLAYRTRSMPFCFVHRGPARQTMGELGQDDEDEVYQPLVRPAILVVSTRFFALGILVLNLLVNFDVLSDDTMVGRTGWATVVNNPDEDNTMMIIIALFPMLLVCCLCLYFSCLLWRYGCQFSMIINASLFNAWISPVFGAVAMTVGQMFGPDLFLITSNTGILLYYIAMVRVLYEIRHDIREAGDLGHFLNALEKASSDKINENTSITNIDSTPSTMKVTNVVGSSTKISSDAVQTKEIQSTDEEIGTKMVTLVSSETTT